MTVPPDRDDLELAEAENELPVEVQQKKSSGRLRTGYTTGTCAAAATKAALISIQSSTPVECVTVTLPKNRSASIPIKWTDMSRISDKVVSCAVLKDGGDDPDVTSGTEICSTVQLTDKPGLLEIDGGQGVGRVTKPGLGLEIGKAAINPIPVWMITRAVNEVAGSSLSEQGIRVLISVPKGAEIAVKTDNPRLGILGGISILGTTGIVLPYSTASFAASIRQSLDVAVAMGVDTVVLTTGGRSEDFAKALYGHLPDHAFIQMGDFVGYSIKQCAQKKISKVIIAAFVGKLTKMAMGVKQTHVAGSHVDMDFMANVASECGAIHADLERIRKANTARHVSEIIRESQINGFFDLICEKVWQRMHEHSKGALNIEVCMFEFDGSLIGRFPDKLGNH